jgi:predicted PurR-regulated permease PerM
MPFLPKVSKIESSMENNWSSSTKYLVVGLYIAGFIALVSATRSLLGPLVIALLLAYVLNPIAAWLTRRTNLVRSRAVTLTFLAFITLVIAIPSSFTSLIARQISRLPNDVESILLAIDSFIAEPIQIGQFTLDPPRDTIISLEQEIRSLASQASSLAVETLSGLGTNLIWLIIIFVTTFYLLRDGPKLKNWILRLFPDNYQLDVDKLIGQMDIVWGTYLRGQVILATIIGVMTGVSMALVGLPGALAIGLIAGVLDLIPSLGPLVGGVISVFVALILGSSNLAVSNLWFGIIVGIIFILIQQFENIWLAPKILGESLKLHPSLVIIGVLGALTLSGILAALVVIPLIASGFIISRYVHAKLLDKDPWEVPIEKEEIPAEIDGQAESGAEENQPGIT